MVKIMNNVALGLTIAVSAFGSCQAAVKRRHRSLEDMVMQMPVGDNGMMPPLDPQVMEALTNTMIMAVGTCDIDTSFMDAATKLSTGDTSEMQTYFDIFKNTCDASQEQTFLQSLKTFETCSGIDILDYMEYLPSAIVGSITECISTFDPALLTGNPEDMERLEISDQCRNSFLGKNIFGDANRIFMMYPERSIQCFKSMSVTIPMCTYQTWPIPLVGNILKKVACLMGQLSPVIEAAAFSELSKLEQCLPDSLKSTTCEEVRKGCREAGSMLSGVAVVIDSLEGMPLNDAYLTVAKQRGLDHTIAKYDGFNKACSDHPWDGWKDDTKVLPPGHPVSPSGSGGGAASAPQSAIVSAAATPSTTMSESSSSRSVGVFFGGLFTGLVVTGLAAMMIIRKKKLTERYENIEMSGGHQLDLSLW